MNHTLRSLATATAIGFVTFAGLGAAQAQDIKIAHIYGKTGPFEAYAKQSHTGLMMGLEYATGGSMAVNGRKIVVIEKDTQLKPDQGKALLAAAYGDDKVDLAIGPVSSGVALAMLPVAAEYKKMLLVEPAVADSITGDKWNRYIFRTSRNSTQDAVAAAASLQGRSVDRDAGAGLRLRPRRRQGVQGRARQAESEGENRSRGIRADQDDRLHRACAARVRGAQGQAGTQGDGDCLGGRAPDGEDRSDLKPDRFGIELAPGGNILPVMKGWKDFAGVEGAIYYYYGFPKNKVNDWLVMEHQKRFDAPPDFFTAGGMAAGIAAVEAIKKAGGTDTEKLIAAMQGMSFETPKGTMTFRKEDHQAMQSMYHFRIKKKDQQKGEWDLLELVREIPASEMPIPIRNK